LFCVDLPILNLIKDSNDKTFSNNRHISAVIGLEPGKSTSIDIPANEAYGPYKDELTQEIPKSSLPEDLNPEIGQRLVTIQK